MYMYVLYNTYKNNILEPLLPLSPLGQAVEGLEG